MSDGESDDVSDETFKTEESEEADTDSSADTQNSDEDQKLLQELEQMRAEGHAPQHFHLV